MKAVILAGGFARRMGRLGIRTPKALLPIAGRPVIEHILERMQGLGIDKVFVSTNKRFEQEFSDWAAKTAAGLVIELVVEPAMEEGQKLGSIGGLQFLIEQKSIEEDILVVNGDNLFGSGLEGFISFYKAKKAFTFGVYDTRSIDEAQKMGVVLSDQSGQVMDFEEKPENPKSTLVSTGIYLFPRETLPLIKQYTDEGNSTDRMGDFLAWLMKRQALFSFRFDGIWFDIGSPETYGMAQMLFKA